VHGDKILMTLAADAQKSLTKEEMKEYKKEKS
jgi:hypothetical protein